MRIFLIRHGQTEWNSNGRCQGHTDTELDATGHHQAVLLGERFYKEPLKKVYTSDLKRAHSTGKAIADSSGAPIEVLTELRERSFGVLEGRPFIEISTALAVSRQGRFEFKPDEGESFQDVWNRVLPFTMSLLDTEEPVAVVTHGGTLSMMLAQLIGAPIESSGAFRFANTGVTELGKLPDGRWHLAKYNDTRHLESIHELETALVGSIDGTTR